MSEKEKDYIRLYEEEKSRREKIEKDYIGLKEKTNGINKKLEEINKKNEETNNKIKEITNQNQSIAMNYQIIKQEKENLENGIIKAIALIGKK